MKKINLKNSHLSILIIVGVLVSTLSFVYYFALKNPYQVIYWLFCIIDLSIFATSVYYVLSLSSLSKTKRIFITIITMIAFFVFCEAVGFILTEGSLFEHNLVLFFNVLRFALFLSPSFILLLPVMMFIAEIAS